MASRDANVKLINGKVRRGEGRRSVESCGRIYPANARWAAGSDSLVKSLTRERFRRSVSESRKARPPRGTFNSASVAVTLREPYITGGRGRALSSAFVESGVSLRARARRAR